MSPSVYNSRSLPRDPESSPHAFRLVEDRALVPADRLERLHERASNRLVDIEDLTEEELEKIKKFYIRLSDLAEKENDVNTSHSLSEAENVHEFKRRKTGR